MSSSNSKDSFIIDGIGSFSQPVNGGSGHAGYSFNFPAPASNGAASASESGGPAPKKIQVVRRLNDDVQLSRESGADEGSADSLCSNFMAAWG